MDGSKKGIDEMNEESMQALLQDVSGGSVKLAEPMSLHTTFRIGGPADYFVEPAGAKKAMDTIIICRRQKIPCYVVGRGSNLLVGDRGIRGVVVHIGDSVSGCALEDGKIYAEAGISLAVLAHLALENSLEGFEFAAGIPGSLGGALVMNAGAYGGEMKDVVKAVQVFTPDGLLRWVDAGDMDFGYRRSILQKDGGIALAAEIELREGDSSLIKTRMAELSVRRRTKQPLEYPSAGSTFKRPEGYFAGKLIEECGLAGFSVGGAAVSQKHCGFVINKGEATASDVLELCGYVQSKVKEKFGVWLEKEIRCIGGF